MILPDTPLRLLALCQNIPAIERGTRAEYMHSLSAIIHNSEVTIEAVTTQLPKFSEDSEAYGALAQAGKEALALRRSVTSARRVKNLKTLKNRHDKILQVYGNLKRSIQQIFFAIDHGLYDQVEKVMG